MERKLSKIETLTLAKNYIMALTNVICEMRGEEKPYTYVVFVHFGFKWIPIFLFYLPCTATLLSFLVGFLMWIVKPMEVEVELSKVPRQMTWSQIIIACFKKTCSWGTQVESPLMLEE